MMTFRTRLAVAMVSLAVIALELTLMRALAVRFWYHFACMVIGVALLGFGASGTMLTLLRRWVVGRQRWWLCLLSLFFSLSIPLSVLGARAVRLDVQYLVWDLSQIGHVLLLELLVFVPFFFAGAMVGVALMDHADRIAGHYAANLIGSGAGAVLAVVLMYVLSTSQLIVAVAAIGFLAATILAPLRRGAGWCVIVGFAAAIGLTLWTWPPRLGISPYKMLQQVMLMPGTERIHHSEGPLGRIDVVTGPAIHHTPGLGLQWTKPIPPHVLMIVDGDQTSAVYDCRRREDWAFLDHTTAALPYHLRDAPSVLIIGAGGGSDIGLATFRGSSNIVALEMNRQIIATMTGPLAERGGAIYYTPGVHVLNYEARGFLAGRTRQFDVIQLPAVDAFGASGAGLYAAQESYLYTIEAFSAMFDHLTDKGVLCITRWSRTPPRDGLRVFDTAVQALRDKRLNAASHLAMIRSLTTVTVLLFKRPINDTESETIRTFCRQRGFDLCYFPDMTGAEANRFQILDRPYYFDGTRALLGDDRQAYLSNYLFDVSAPSDDRPYFHHFFRWHSVPILRSRLGGVSRSFLEVGYLMLVAALVQAVVLAAVMILLPLTPKIGALRSTCGRAAGFGYFLLLGVGFMLVEMGFLQKLILYLADPIYSAAAVIGSFLVFGGVGSMISGRWSSPGDRVSATAATVIVCLTLTYALVLDDWLALTRAQASWCRFVVAAATIAPLALAMGQMFPTGLRRVSSASPTLVPWAWSVNGFASVVATMAAPLAAMHVGFSRLVLVAAGCYALSGVLFRRLAKANNP